MRASIVVTFLLAAGCGGGRCMSDFTGHWVGTTLADSVDLGDDCSFRYTGSGGCESLGEYAAPIGNQGSVKVSIGSSTGGLCLPAGDYVCVYSASAKTLTFNCGGGVTSYGR